MKLPGISLVKNAIYFKTKHILHFFLKKINIKGKNSSCDECDQIGKLGRTCKYTLRKALKKIKQMKI